MPQITVIVPVYQVDKYLQRCVDSILAQTVTDYELILVDDGSPDVSGQIDDEYAAQDDRIISIHQKNGGVSSARNDGLDIACGEHITFIDSDDYVLANYFEELFHPEYDMVCQTVILLDENNHFLNRGVLPECAYGKPSEDDMIELLQNTALHYTPCKCYKASIIQSHHVRFDNEIDFAEDTLFSVQYLAKATSVLVQNISNYQYIQYQSRMTLSGAYTDQRIRMLKKANHLISMAITDDPIKQNEIFVERITIPYFFHLRDCYEVFSPFQIIHRLSCLWRLTTDADFHAVLKSGTAYGLSDEMSAAIQSGNKWKVTVSYIRYCLYLIKVKLCKS